MGRALGIGHWALGIGHGAGSGKREARMATLARLMPLSRSSSPMTFMKGELIPTNLVRVGVGARVRD